MFWDYGSKAVRKTHIASSTGGLGGLCVVTGDGTILSGLRISTTQAFTRFPCRNFWDMSQKFLYRAESAQTGAPLIHFTIFRYYYWILSHSRNNFWSPAGLVVLPELKTFGTCPKSFWIPIKTHDRVSLAIPKWPKCSPVPRYPKIESWDVFQSYSWCGNAPEKLLGHCPMSFCIADSMGNLDHITILWTWAILKGSMCFRFHDSECTVSGFTGTNSHKKLLGQCPKSFLMLSGIAQSRLLKIPFQIWVGS